MIQALARMFSVEQIVAPAQQVAPRLSNVISEGQVASSSDPRMLDLFGSTRTDSGAVVNDRTAMRVSAVYACVRLIAGAIAGLPLPIYRRNDDAREKVDHPLWWLLNELPCPGWSSAQFWEFVVSCVLLRGDCICYLRRNRLGEIIAVVPHHPDYVYIDRVAPADPRDPPRLVYYFWTRDGSFGAEADDVLHFAGFGFDGRRSMSVIQWGARSGIGIAIKGDEFAGKFYSQGAQPQFALKTTSKMSPTQQQDLRDAWTSKYSGTGPNGIPLILTEGIDVKELTMSAVDAQLLESRQWQVVDICRAFGVPPFMAAEMGKATYNNTENLGADFVKYTLSPHLNRFELEINIKFWPRSLKLFTEFNADGLMRGDSTGRANFYKSALGGTQSPGWMTPNEVRRFENLPPVTDGNTLSKPDPSAKPSQGDDDTKPQKDETL